LNERFIFCWSATNKDDLSEIVDAYDSTKVEITLLFRSKLKLAEVENFKLGCAMSLYPSLKQLHYGHIGTEKSCFFYEEIVSDPMAYALLDRAGQKLNNEERFSYISEGIFKTVSYLIDKAPDFVFFAAPPHHYDTWLFGKIAELLNIRVGFLSFSIFSGLYIYCAGMPGHCKPQIIRRQPIPTERRKRLTSHAMKILERATYTANFAMPAAESRLYGKNKAQVFRPLTSFFERPKSLMKIAFTWRLFNFFEKQKIEPKLEALKYWIFFLHYQPERSTLPEGGLYFNQFEAILRLRSLLPMNETILVKEHPSTFRRLADSRYRNSEFYRRISKLRNTFLVGFNHSSYDLVDKSMGVATITGKIAYEARCRGKPAIIFGEGKYIGPIEELGIKKIGMERQVKLLPSSSVFMPEKYVSWVVRNSVGEGYQCELDAKTLRSNAIKHTAINLISLIKNEQ